MPGPNQVQPCSAPPQYAAQQMIGTHVEGTSSAGGQGRLYGTEYNHAQGTGNGGLHDSYGVVQDRPVPSASSPHVEVNLPSGALGPHVSPGGCGGSNGATFHQGTGHVGALPTPAAPPPAREARTVHRPWAAGELRYVPLAPLNTPTCAPMALTTGDGHSHAAMRQAGARQPQSGMPQDALSPTAYADMRRGLGSHFTSAPAPHTVHPAFAHRYEQAGAPSPLAITNAPTGHDGAAERTAGHVGSAGQVPGVGVGDGGGVSPTHGAGAGAPGPMGQSAAGVPGASEERDDMFGGYIRPHKLEILEFPRLKGVAEYEEWWGRVKHVLQAVRLAA